MNTDKTANRAVIWKFEAILVSTSFDTLLRLLFSSRAAGALGLSPGVFLPPAGLNHIQVEALGTLDGEAFLLKHA
jgi:hypothetical protein